MRRNLVLVSAVATLSLLAFGFGANPAGAGKTGPLLRHVSGVVSVDPDIVSTTAGVHAASVPPPSVTGSSGCPDHSATNHRVNQECTNQTSAALRGRGTSQNETSAAVNPLDPHNVIASQNDYRRGDANCGVDWSNDGGTHWGSTTAPMNFTTPGFTAARHYWNAGGDTSVAFDSGGEAYLMCQVFDRGSVVDLGLPQAFGASGFLLFRSADGGASWSFQGSPVALSSGDHADGIGLLDKEYMAIDSNPGSPYVDRIYVSWTQYNVDFTSAPVYFAYSDDHGATFTNVGEISGSDTGLCPVHFGNSSGEGECDATSFSEPFVAPNGDVHVVFADYNNCSGSLQAFGFDCPGDPTDNHNQMLIVKSTDGGATFGDPVKVADFNELPDCYKYTGDDFGRACVPTAPSTKFSVFRAANYPSGGALSNTEIVVDLGSYINPHSNPTLGNCVPAGLVRSTGLNKYTGVGKVNGCNNDILRSVSTDGGASFTGTTTPPESLPAISNENANYRLADQFWQWTAVSPVSGEAVAAYYDRKYAPDQAKGRMDITVYRSNGSHVRATDSSMPPSNEFPGASGYSVFMGDYNAVAVGSDGVIHPVWADSRNPIYVFDPASADPRVLSWGGYGADIYAAAVPDA